METAVSFSQAEFRASIIKEYLLVVNLQNEIAGEVMREKENFYKKYHAAGERHLMPQLLVANFLAKEEMEDILLRWMQRIIGNTKSFQAELNNYSGLPNEHTIYLRIQDPQPFKKLARSLKVIDELVQQNGLPKARIVNSPYLGIAGQLEKTVYETAMMDYSKKEFHSAFEVKELALMKRTHQFDGCKQVSVFRLQP